MSKEFKRTPYSEKLRDPRWQKMRLTILNRDDWACQICFDKANTLNVHHRMYESGKEPWEYAECLLVTLCENCHENETNRRADEEAALLKILRWKFFSQDLSQIGRLLAGMPMLHIGEVQLSAVAAYLENEANVGEILNQKDFTPMPAWITELFSPGYVDSMRDIVPHLKDARKEPPWKE